MEPGKRKFGSLSTTPQPEQSSIKVDNDAKKLEEPRTKRRKMATKVCDACCEDVPMNRFPLYPHQGAPVWEHENDHNVCFKCRNHHLTSQLDSSEWNELTCAVCEKQLTQAEIVQLAKTFPKGLIAKIEEKSFLAALRADADWVNCPSSTCKYGASMSDGHIFTCQSCELRYCFSCQVPMHENMSCTEYKDKELKRVDEKVEEEKLSLSAVRKYSKACPKCSVRLQKNRSCDHFTCKACKHEFCWLCFADFNGLRGVKLRGNEAHADTCRYHSRALPNYQPTHT